MNFIQKIELKKIDKHDLYIYSIGQSGYLLYSKDAIIYIDPYLSDYIENSKGLDEKDMHRNFPPPINPNEITKCDAIVCTHSHVDHMDPWTINKIKTNFKFYTSIGAYEKSEINIPESRIIFLYPKNTYEIGSIKLIPFPAAHYELTDDSGRPDCLSILIKWKNKTLFFWGDGISYDGQNELLSNFSFDYFFAPINGRDKAREKKGVVGNIKENELAEFCSKLSIKHIVPNHYDMFINNTGSINLFQNEVIKRNPNQSIIIMNCGNKIKLRGL